MAEIIKVVYRVQAWRRDDEVTVGEGEDVQKVLEDAKQAAMVPTGNPFIEAGSLVWKRTHYSDGTWRDFLYASFDENGEDDTAEMRMAFGEATDERLRGYML